MSQQDLREVNILYNCTAEQTRSGHSKTLDNKNLTRSDLKTTTVEHGKILHYKSRTQ